MLPPTIKKNDPKAKLLIYAVSIIVFAAVVILSKVKLHLYLPFNPHVFATVSAIINSLVAVLLLAGLITVKQKKYRLHKKIMMSAIILSVLFLLSYIAHHLLTDETKFGGEGMVKTVYYVILFSHIPLAGIILPFILFTAYRALIGEYEQHKKLTRITWPIWFYVAITGVIVYLMISPYYVN
jgi:putative membrane protein